MSAQVIKASLVDCFMEIFAYTLNLIKEIEQGEKPDFNIVKKNYETLFERSARQAAQAGFSNVKWKKGSFPVCAFVDEKILCSSWSDKIHWMNHQLQRKYFHTTNAGQEFFQRMEKLTDDDKELREIYSYCLTLGFNGRYYSDDEKDKLQEIKADNLLKYFQDDEDVALPEVIFPEAYPDEVRKLRHKTSFFTRAWPYLFILPPFIIGALYWLAKLHLDKLSAILF